MIPFKTFGSEVPDIVPTVIGRTGITFNKLQETGLSESGVEKVQNFAQSRNHFYEVLWEMFMDFDDILPGASRAVAVTVGAIDSVT